MISVKQSFELLYDNIPTKQEVELSLLEAQNYVISQDVISPIDMPYFRQSAMDGFAVFLHEKLTYEIIGEIKAGDSQIISLKAGQAVKIFTGAAVPDTADAVIQIEKTTIANSLLVLKEQPNSGVNIRPVGEQIKKNELALAAGTMINPAAIGFLAGLGITKVSVFKKSAVGIIVTGNELTPPGKPLEYGKIYESNAVMLQAALANAHCKNVKEYKVNDDFVNTKSTINTALEENDILLISGGISVGDYDFVKSALDEIDVKTIFYKVRQKPGKPLLFGRKGDKLVFALPGNPAAALTCFYIYVLPVLHLLSGKNSIQGLTSKRELSEDLSVNKTVGQFLKAHFTENEVSVLSHQNSSMLNTFSLANCLIYLPEGEYELKKGSKVDIYFI